MGAKSKGGVSKKGRQHVAHEKKYQKQFSRTAANKEKAWDRHINKYPKDLLSLSQIKEARHNLKIK